MTSAETIMQGDNPIDKFLLSEIYLLENYVTANKKSLKELIERIEPFDFVDLFREELHDEDMVLVIKYGVYEKKCSYLSLAQNNFTQHSMFILSRALCRFPNLKELDLSFNPIGDEGVRILAQALSSSDCFLTELDLTCTKIADEGAQSLAAVLPENKRLKRLILNNNEIKGPGLHSFIESLTHPNTSLEILKLEKNGEIPPDDIRYFIEQINVRQSKIREIYFTHCLPGSRTRRIEILNCCDGSVKIFY